MALRIETSPRQHGIQERNAKVAGENLRLIMVLVNKCVSHLWFLSSESVQSVHRCTLTVLPKKCNWKTTVDICRDFTGPGVMRRKDWNLVPPPLPTFLMEQPAGMSLCTTARNVPPGSWVDLVLVQPTVKRLRRSIKGCRSICQPHGTTRGLCRPRKGPAVVFPPERNRNVDLLKVDLPPVAAAVGSTLNRLSLLQGLSHEIPKGGSVLALVQCHWSVDRLCTQIKSAASSTIQNLSSPMILAVYSTRISLH